MPPCCATAKPVASSVNLPNFYSFGHISDRQVAEKLADPLDRLHDRLAAVGVGKAQIALAKLTKARTGHSRDPGLVEQLALESAGIKTRAAYIGERVERAARLRAAKPGQAVERRDDRLAALGEGGDHSAHRLARALQRRDPGKLGGGVDAGMAIDREPLGRAEQCLGPHPIAQPPAGHRIGLAPPVEQDHTVADGWVAEQAAMFGAVIEDLAIDLVAEDGDLGMPREPGDQPVELFPRHDAARRIGRTVDDQQASARRNLVEHLLGAERKAGAFVERNRHRRGSGEADHALVDRKARVRVEDLDPRLAEHQDREKHRDLAAGDHEHEIGGDLDPVPAKEVGGDRGAQRRDAVGWSVAVMAVGERLAAGFDDVFRGREIRLADPEVDDGAAVRGEGIGARQHLERRLGPEHPHASGHLQHRLPPENFRWPKLARSARGGDPDPAARLDARFRPWHAPPTIKLTLEPAMIDLYAMGSPNVVKIYIALEEMGLPYTVHPVDVFGEAQFEPEFLKLNPNAKVPVITDHEGAGGKPYTLFESGQSCFTSLRRPASFCRGIRWRGSTRSSG